MNIAQLIQRADQLRLVADQLPEPHRHLAELIAVLGECAATEERLAVEAIERLADRATFNLVAIKTGGEEMADMLPICGEVDRALIARQSYTAHLEGLVEVFDGYATDYGPWPTRPKPDFVRQAEYRGCGTTGCSGTGGASLEEVDGEKCWVVSCPCGCGSQIWQAEPSPLDDPLS